MELIFLLAKPIFVSWIIQISWVFIKRIDDKELNQLSQSIQSNYGIKMPPIKKVVLQGLCKKGWKNSKNDYKHISTMF
jgi:hypothetical protein